MMMKQKVCAPGVGCHETIGAIVPKRIQTTGMARVNSAGWRVQMFPLMFEIVDMRSRRQKRVKATILLGL